MSKPRTRKPPRRPSVPAHRSYTPELLANGRRRVEQTDESVASIASDFGIHHYSLLRLAKREGWLLHERPRRDLPPAARLLAQAQALEAAQPLPAESPAPPDLSVPLAAQIGEGEAMAAASGIDASTIDRLENAVLAELATVEAMRAQLGTLPRQAVHAERTARTLSTLTETLQKLQRLRCAVPFSGSDDDDMLADIDEFRLDLARRIDAFVTSRSEPEEADGDRSAS